jgi:hypothetical protein
VNPYLTAAWQAANSVLGTVLAVFHVTKHGAPADETLRAPDLPLPDMPPLLCSARCQSLSVVPPSPVRGRERGTSPACCV